MRQSVRSSVFRRRLFMPNPVRTAIILAAGRGRRMWPYDELRPKAILPILNQPLIGRLVDDLTAVGIQRIIVVVGHQSQRVKHALAGREYIEFVEQARPEGTAPAVLAAMPLVEDETFLVVHGDLLVDQADLRALLRTFAQGDGYIATLVHPLNREDSRDWLCASVQDDLLTAVEGHPRRKRVPPYRPLCHAPERLAPLICRDNPGFGRACAGGRHAPRSRRIWRRVCRWRSTTV